MWLSIALTVLRYLWPFLLLGGAYWWADDGWCNHACTKQKSAVVAANNRADAAELKVKAAQDRATALALLWSAQVDKTDAAVKKEKDEQATQFKTLADRINALPKRTCAVGPDVERLLGDIAAAANAAGAPAVDSKAGAAVSKPAGPAVKKR